MSNSSARGVSLPYLLAAGFAVLVAISGVSLWLGNELERDARLVSHTFEVQAKLEALRRHVRRAESGERGYLLTGDPTDLEIHRAGVAGVEESLAAVRRLTADNPAQQEELRAVEPLMRARLDAMAEVIRRGEAQDRAGVLTLIRDGRAVMEAIGERIERMSRTEQSLLETRSVEFRATRRWLLAATLAGVLLIVALATVSVLQIRRSTNALWKAHRALEAANAGLEATVAERTADLGESEALKSAILESALDCVVTITDESRIVEWNPAAERTFGYAREAALGQPLADLIIPPEFRERHYEGLARYLATGRGSVLGKRIELEALRADGSRFPVELAITVAHVENKTHFTAYLRDITERKRAQAELLESNEEIQRFAYIVSHDLRAPLVNIMGFTSELEALRDDVFARLRERRDAADGRPAESDETLAEDFTEALGFIKASTGKMDRLINAILNLSREGRRAFAPEPVDMTMLLNGIANSLAHQAEAADATIEIGDLPPLASDRLAMEQVFSNLLDNALKYLRPGEPGRIAVAGRAIGSRVVYEVRDNGRGIAERDRERVFELFRRAGAQDRPGEGIGLAHVRALVRRLGGAIRLESEPGRGSTFTVVLPKAWSAETERKAA